MSAPTEAVAYQREVIRRMREHLEHMTDGRWHDDCKWCLRRREFGGTGLTPLGDDWRPAYAIAT